MFKLNIQKRDLNIDINQLRAEDKVPAVFYGKGVESTPIMLSYSEFKSVWKEAGTSALIELEGVDETKEVIIKGMDIHPVTSQVRHIDFYVIERGKLMEAVVALEFIGESPAVKNLGAVLTKSIHELKIEVLPRNLPSSIEVDFSSLKELGDQIAVKDLKLPEGVTILDDENETIASVAEAKEEIVEEESVSIEDIEIEQKGKGEEEGGDADDDGKKEEDDEKKEK